MAFLLAVGFAFDIKGGQSRTRSEDFFMGYPSVYPTGVTIYDPDQAASGYTIFQAPGVGALLIDMSGREVQLWQGLQGFPNKLLPGGQVLGSTGERDPRYGAQDQVDLVQVDWEGNVRWRFERLEHISDPGAAPRWMARQHHDYQRQGSPVRYFAPGQDPLTDRGHTLILVHENVTNRAISPHPLLDDRIVEVDWQGRIVWQWRPHEHFEELGFDAEARAALRNNPNRRALGAPALGSSKSLGSAQVQPSGAALRDGATLADGYGDWLHINALSFVGPNKWYDAGDQRFHPDNLIWDAREANIIAIVDKRSGKIVWKIGPPNVPALEPLPTSSVKTIFDLRRVSLRCRSRVGGVLNFYCREGARRVFGHYGTPGQEPHADLETRERPLELEHPRAEQRKPANRRINGLGASGTFGTLSQLTRNESSRAWAESACEAAVGAR